MTRRGETPSTVVWCGVSPSTLHGLGPAPYTAWDEVTAQAIQSTESAEHLGKAQALFLPSSPIFRHGEVSTQLTLIHSLR